MLYGQTMFIGSNSQKESRYLSSPVNRCRIWLPLDLNNVSDSVSSISSVKNSPANAIKLSAAVLNLVRVSLFDRRDSKKPDKINISLLSGSGCLHV